MTEKVAIFETLTGKINLQVHFLMLSARKSRCTLRGMNTLQTAISTLEPMVVAHAPEMFEVLSDPAIYEFENEPPPSVQRLADGYARRETRVSPDGCERWLNWAIRLRTGELAGYVQATVLASGASYIAYELSSRFWRRGIGSAAVTAMMSELASHYQVHTFVAVLKTANFRSVALLTHLGFAPGSVAQMAEFEAEADERLMVRPAALGAISQ